MKQSILRDKFKSENYQYSIASDMRNFPDMANGDDVNLEWRVDWFIAIEKGRYSPKARLSPLPANSKSEFDRVNRELNKDTVKIAECSKYASHAMSILLSDQSVTDEYNVCIAGIGPSQNHNIVLLIPKDTPPAEIKSGGRLSSIPNGALIVDPWAMAMGHDEKSSLAVKPEEYVYPDLLTKIKLHYQSANDPQVSPPPKAAMARKSNPVSPVSDTKHSPAPESPPAIGVKPQRIAPLVAPKPVRHVETPSSNALSSAPNLQKPAQQKPNTLSLTEEIKQRLVTLKKSGEEPAAEAKGPSPTIPRSPK